MAGHLPGSYITVRTIANRAALTKKATHLPLESGKVSKTHKTIPVHWIDTITEREVRLAVGSNLLVGMPEYQN